VRSRSYIDSDAGYTPDFFAFKRGLSIQQAVRLIQAVGPSRETRRRGFNAQTTVGP
jgi:hypothetical protein